jgi:hypothetical protein
MGSLWAKLLLITITECWPIKWFSYKVKRVIFWLSAQSNFCLFSVVWVNQLWRLFSVSSGGFIDKNDFDFHFNQAVLMIVIYIWLSFQSDITRYNYDLISNRQFILEILTCRCKPLKKPSIRSVTSKTKIDENLRQFWLNWMNQLVELFQLSR